MSVVWVAYFGLTPVTWFPGLSSGTVQAVKAALFAIGVTLTWKYCTRRALPRGLLGPVGVAALALASTFALFQANSDTVWLRRLSEIVLAFGILWTFFVLERSVSLFIRIAAWTAVVHGLFSVVIVLAFFRFVRLGASSTAGTSVLESGFGDGSTGWAAGVVLFSSFGVAGAFTERYRVAKAFMGFSVVVSTIGLVIIGARAGAVVAVLAVAFVGISKYGWRFALLYLVGLAAAVATFWDYLLVAMHFDRIGAFTFVDIDSFTAGRLTSLATARDLILERPLFGWGFGVPRVELGPGIDVSIHNVWLRMAAEGGLVLVFAFLLIVFQILTKATATMRQRFNNGEPSGTVESTAILVTLVGGLLVSLVEPNRLLGSMHTASGWWAVAGTAVAACLVYDNGATSTSAAGLGLHRRARSRA